MCHEKETRTLSIQNRICVLSPTYSSGITSSHMLISKNAVYNHLRTTMLRRGMEKVSFLRETMSKIVESIQPAIEGISLPTSFVANLPCRIKLLRRGNALGKRLE
jgi:hypothetical protein